MDNLKPQGELDFSTSGPTTIAEKWHQWKQTMQLFIELTMTKSSEKEKCSAFLYVIGQAGRDIYNTMTLTEKETGKIDVLFTKFEAYCKPKQNVTIERYHFNTRAQGRGETIDQYVTELRLIAKNCKFGNLENELIRDRIVCGTSSDDVRQRPLRVEDLSLDKAISICRADAESKQSSQYLAENSDRVHGLRKSHSAQSQRSSGRGGKQSTTEPMKQPCGSCGLRHPRKQCPAYGKQCRKCNKFNHFSKYCGSSRTTDAIEQNEDSDSGDSEHSLFIGAITSKTKVTGDECHTSLQVQNLTVRFKVDTGSQVNILPQAMYDKLSTKPLMTKPVTKLTSYSGGNLKVVGCTRLMCEHRQLEFHIVDTTQDPILGLSASQELGIVKIVLNIDRGTPQLTKRYPKLFQGLGCLKSPYHIEIDPSVTPVVCPPRNQPVALRERLKQTLNEMESMGVIRKVDVPTDWVNSLVVFEKPKSKKLHICLDPRPLNKAIRREHFQLPTLEDITTRLSGACFFSKLYRCKSWVLANPPL